MLLERKVFLNRAPILKIYIYGGSFAWEEPSFEIGIKMFIETHSCDQPLALGTHKRGSGSASLVDIGADFKSCSVKIGMPIYNITQSTDGLITVVTEDEVTDDTNTWDTDDEYEIYFQTKDSLVSSIIVDKRFGRKTNLDIMVDNIHPNDRDLDEDLKAGDDPIFGLRQPEKGHS